MSEGSAGLEPVKIFCISNISIISMLDLCILSEEADRLCFPGARAVFKLAVRCAFVPGCCDSWDACLFKNSAACASQPESFLYCLLRGRSQF